MQKDKRGQRTRYAPRKHPPLVCRGQCGQLKGRVDAHSPQQPIHPPVFLKFFPSFMKNKVVEWSVLDLNEGRRYLYHLTIKTGKSP